MHIVRFFKYYKNNRLFVVNVQIANSEKLLSVIILQIKANLYIWFKGENKVPYQSCFSHFFDINHDEYKKKSIGHQRKAHKEINREYTHHGDRLGGMQSSRWYLYGIAEQGAYNEG